MIRTILVMIALFAVGCDTPLNRERVSTPPQIKDVIQKEPTKKSGSVTFGPKMNFGPSFNLRKGKMEWGPSFKFGPRLHF